MGLTKAIVEAQFSAARTVLSGSNVSVRHDGHEYTGVRSSVEFSDQPGAMGALQGADGAVRLLVSELSKPHPEAGNTIDVKAPDGTEWQRMRVVMPRYDQVNATVRLDYEEQF